MNPIIGYRVAVASREDHPTAPPRGHRDWMRVVRSLAESEDDGLAVDRDRSRGKVWRTRTAAEREASAWATYWHTRLVRVVDNLWYTCERCGRRGPGVRAR